MVAPSRAAESCGYQIWRSVSDVDAFNSTGASPITATRGEPDASVVRIRGLGWQRTEILAKCELVIVRMGKVKINQDETDLMNAAVNGLKDKACLQ